jgi:hypothetical protein
MLQVPKNIVRRVVTRYLDEKHVESFFRDGTLRIPSFRLFRENPDEQRGDYLEGRVAAELDGPNIHYAIQAWNGQAAFVMCGSLVESERMEEIFSTKSAIRILDIGRFANVVSRHIPGFVEGMQGNCIYRRDTVLRKAVSQTFEPPQSEEAMEAWAAKHDQFIAEQTREGYFLKRLKYEEQNEYRLIWFAHSDDSKEALFVTCPEARVLCERV